MNDRDEVSRDVWLQVIERRSGGVFQIVEKSGFVGPIKCWPQREHFIKSQPQRILIASFVGRLLERFGRQIPERSQNAAFNGQRRFDFCFL